MIRDIIGKRFGRLVVLKFAYQIKYAKFFECLCDCGNTCFALKGDLIASYTKSCGCLKRETIENLKKTHGQSNTRTFRIWCNMRARCRDPNATGYKNYGERGLKVCKRWESSFTNFLKDMGKAPVGFTIERKDNNKDYNPENCCWASRIEQNNNNRHNRYEIFKGLKKTTSQWAKTYKINYQTFMNRLYKGWSLEKALTTPVRGAKSNSISLND